MYQTVSCVIALALAVLSAAVVQPARANPPQAEDFARAPALSEPSLSPSAEFVAVRQRRRGETVLVTYRVGSDAQPSLWAVPDNTKIIAWNWVADDRLLIDLQVMDQISVNTRAIRFRITDIPTVRVVIIDPAGQDHRILFDDAEMPFLGVMTSQVIDLLPYEPQHVLLAPGSTGRSSVYRVNVYTGEAEEIISGLSGTFHWLADGDGILRLRAEASGGRVRIFSRNTGQSDPKKGWSEIYSFEALLESNLVLSEMSLDGQTAFVQSNHEGRMGLYRLDLTSSEINLERLFLHDRVDMLTAVHDVHTREPIAVTFIDDQLGMHFFDDEFERLYRQLQRSLPGPNVEIAGRAENREAYLIAETGRDYPTVYYVLDAERGTLTELGPVYPDLTGQSFGQVETLRYQTRDGLEIGSYLTFPPGAAERPLPLVVLPHGGPQVRDIGHFDPLAQYIASRGYLVFQMNYRGSTGYGAQFQRAGYGQWGLAMQDDITDGVHALIDRGYADADRICIVGLSYGAYAALMGAVSTPDLYQCAVGIAGVYDLEEMLEQQTRFATAYAFALSPAEYWEIIIGDPDKDRARLRQTSPLTRARDIHIPIMLGHGRRDRVVPMEQTQEMYRALRMRRGQRERNYYRRSGHQFEIDSEREEMFRDITRFLDRHL